MIACFLTAFFLLLAPLGLAGAGDDTEGQTEDYVYETFTVGDEKKERQETVRMTINHSTNGVLYIYKSRRLQGWEIVHVSIDTNHQAESGLKTEYDEAGNIKGMARIWIEDEKLQMESTRPDHKKVKRTKELADTTLAMDVSLLFALRSFPFEEDCGSDYGIAAFSGHYLNMAVRTEGTETITVPAGTFECYRLVGEVDLIIKKLATVYWLTRKPPHFLIKYEGKRGIFLAPDYTTILVNMGKDTKDATLETEETKPETGNRKQEPEEKKQEAGGQQPQ